MRTQLVFALASVAAAGVALVNSAFAANPDSTSSIRGSLGASLTDLSLDNGFGVWAFAINAAFALIFVIVACALTRRMPSQSGSTRHIALPWLHRRAC
jgi:hypothetical protein